jgi:DNA polymerase I-like protein with 3'-5' exonuclease and polymerase domains
MQITFQLKELFAVELEKHKPANYSEEIEILVPVLAAMETEGIRRPLEKYVKCRKKSILSNKIYETAGEKFNLSSPNNWETFFDKLNRRNKAKLKENQDRTICYR